MTQNPEIELAHQFVRNTNTTIFLTGKAGTGKTTFLRSLKETARKYRKDKIDIIKSLDLLIIDELSMVRAD